MATPVIELDGLARTYPGPPPVPALRPADLVIEAGDYVAITGPSGSGKSTLLHLLGLLDTPTAGRYLLDGLDTSTLNDKDRSALRGRQIGIVFQAFHLLPYRSALENVLLAQLYNNTPAAPGWPRRSRHWTRSAWGTASTRCPPRCRAGSASGSRSPGRWSTSHPCCCATSRPGTWIRPTRPR